MLPQPPGPARAAARADPHHRPARLRPRRPALAPRRTPARHADRAARPGRADRARGGGRLRRRCEAAVDQARQRRATDEWLVNRAIARGHVAEAVDFYLRFALASRGPPAPGRALPVAPRLRAALPARGPATRRGRPDRGARAGSHARPRSRSCRCAASRGSTSSWTIERRAVSPTFPVARRSGGQRQRCAAAPRATRAAVPEHHEPEDREAEQEEREVRDRGHHDQHGQHHQERGRNPAAKRPEARVPVAVVARDRGSGRDGGVGAGQVAEDRGDLAPGLRAPRPARAARRARRRSADPGRSARPGRPPPLPARRR